MRSLEGAHKRFEAHYRRSANVRANLRRAVIDRAAGDPDGEMCQC